MTHAPARASLALAIAMLAVSVAACGGSDSDEIAGPDSAATDYEKALAGAPPKLAALHEQANELLDGGLPSFRARLEELRGRPVVVNKWASWCGPCRAEFPFFQAQAANRGREIAFLGVDAQDSEEAAQTFLERYPVPYPSYTDPDLEISRELEVETEFPATVYFDSEGERAFVHRGGYRDEEDLAADIERYAN